MDFIHAPARDASGPRFNHIQNRDVERAERQLMHTPVTTPITLPNLRLLHFDCVSDYLEAIVCRITTPRLEQLTIQFFKYFAFSVPRLVQFLNTTESQVRQCRARVL